ncbi:MAG: DUF5658 family protein [Phycisphaerales bacterium]|jgi:hypothetical protein|nr:DUF5658 family protein [Phycisphaerales bacterium]
MKMPKDTTFFAFFSEGNRSKRVMWLLLGIIALSLADLVLTTMYITSVGMAEGNPIAAWLITRTKSIWVLALYKGVTVATCVSLLYYMRKTSRGEMAAWCSMLILTALSIWWNQYALYQPQLPAPEDQIVMIQEDHSINRTTRNTQEPTTLLQ